MHDPVKSIRLTARQSRSYSPARKSNVSRDRVPVEFGFTLVELLVALTIASALTAIALPTLKDSMRQNSLSRAASLVKGAFINARSQAIRTGRPFGIVIERRRHSIGNGTADTLDFFAANYSSRLYYVQSPLEYRGDYQDAVIYPIFEDTINSSDTDNLAPRFFVPRESAGLLYAASTPLTFGNATAATNLIGTRTKFSVGGTDYVFEISALEKVTLDRSNSATGIAGGRTLIHPQVEQVVPTNASNRLVDGTLVSFNYIDFSPRNAQTSGRYANTQSLTREEAASVSVFPAGLAAFQPLPFKFRSNPIKAPLAPVTMIGKTVVDLSVSGSVRAPVAFNAQAIVDADPSSTIPSLVADQRLNDVIVMFAADGQLDGIYSDQRVVGSGPVISGFQYQRFDPATTISFNVGFVDGVVNNVDDIARFPESVPGTDYQINANDPPLETPGPTAALQVKKTPNFANTDCAWIHIQPLSGNITLQTVASQPGLARMQAYYGYNAAPGSQFARGVASDRIRQSRRLATGGAVQ
ncbi:pilus assembly FimT family protein [Roseiconus lacunae]|uniref:Prepilin-type N-terminal cleavage/methylation domain-containing protein n=1 Tax=Roseiconus lacunae TaxID=2605694 RepID=A0ABT7PJN9_9BACT|nr:prepilin-type N-terminal cleavage/methylation domain-containing protein [Roseiconus lacunae]MDM4016553.1 prepilin-type N-terminal cleavage/methylation domain-containing protein [Roseiconus lacunae]